MIDFTKLIEQNLRGERRNTGLLHCSSHLTAPLRHTQLYMTGLFEQSFDLMGAIRMNTGTMWHSWLEQAMAGIPHMSEIDLTPYLPKGWTGRCDYLVWDEDAESFRVVDIKTTKGEGIKWLKGKPKEEHAWQVSAYVHAASNAGIPVDPDTAYVYYLPMNPVIGEDVEPMMVEFEPFPEMDVSVRMDDVQDRVEGFLTDLYINSNGGSPTQMHDLLEGGTYEGLAPIEPPEQKLYKNAKQGVYDVKMVPHWTHNYCPYPEVCGCSDQRTYKIGHFIVVADGYKALRVVTYVPRRGYEDVPLTVTTPTEGMMNSL